MPHASSFPHIAIPDNVDLWTVVFDHQRRQQQKFSATKELMTCGSTGRSYSWADLRSASVEFGKGLKAIWGWKKADVLALYTPNSIDTPIVTLGALWAGGIVSPANPLYTSDELAFQLRDSGAQALVTQKPFLRTAIAAAKKAGLPENRIILLGDQRDGKFRHFCSIRSTSYTGHYAKTSIQPKRDLAFLVYSSGTTGLPKGVCLTHHNMVSNLLQYDYVEGSQWLAHGGYDGNGDKQLGILPFFHIYVSGPSMTATGSPRRALLTIDRASHAASWRLYSPAGNLSFWSGLTWRRSCRPFRIIVSLLL